MNSIMSVPGNATASPDGSAPEQGAHRYHGFAGSRRFAKICVAVVVLHLGMMALYLAPLPVPGPIRSVATAYMEPLFKQSWWVFAPDPVSTNVYLSVRAKKPDGSVTPWFGVTRCDINAAILHHPTPNRRYDASLQLRRHFEFARDALPAKARAAALQDQHGPAWADDLAGRLRADGAGPITTRNYLRYDRSMVELASLVAATRWPGATDVQTQIVTKHTKPFAQRNDPSVKEKVETWTSGFAPSTGVTPTGRDAVASIYGPQGGC